MKKQKTVPLVLHAPPKFFGTSYAFNLGRLGGMCEIGLIRTSLGQYFVGYYGHNKGVTVRLNVAALPCSTQPEELQAQLDDYAEQQGLDPVARISGGAL